MLLITTVPLIYTFLVCCSATLIVLFIVCFCIFCTPVFVFTVVLHHQAFAHVYCESLVSPDVSSDCLQVPFSFSVFMF